MPSPEPLLEFREVMALLRAQCPWKQAQTHRSLARYLLEETHETLEVLDTADGAEGPDDAHLADELGDLLLQVYFHAAIAAERGAFDIDDVARSITDKMCRRNPHVFADPADRPVHEDPAAVDAAWQQIKATERSPAVPGDDPAADLPHTLPALLWAAKALERRARAGWPPPAPIDGSADLGDRLLALVAEANAAGVDPEQALRDAVRRAG